MCRRGRQRVGRKIEFPYRHAACIHRQAKPGLAFDNPPLIFDLFGNVLERTDVADRIRRLSVVEKGFPMRHDPADVPVIHAPDAIAVGLMASNIGIESPCQQPQHLAKVLWMHDRMQSLKGEDVFFRREPENLTRLRGEREQIALEIPLPDPDAGCIDRHSRAALATFQGDLGPLALLIVDDRPDITK